ncbi:MAG: apolipoprotein N-acyltransferase [Boseongicola sp.]|nr:MAG: apolipoprotein N-acyltransferase [Boseongicola sp.]
MAVALLGGAFAALGHAPFGYWPVAVIGFFLIVWTVTNSDVGFRAARAAWYAGLGYFAVTLHWIVEPFLVDVARHGWMAPFALVLMAGGLALFWGAAGWLASRVGGQQRALAFAISLSAAEFLRGVVFTGFPWALPAYIWADTPALGLAAFFGPYGVTLIMLVLVALPLTFANKRLGSGLAFSGLAAMALPSLLVGPDTSILGNVRLVQPNAPQHEKWHPEKAHIFVERQIGFTAEPKGNVDMIVWPETAIPYRLDRAAPVFAQISAAAQGVPVITGINRTENGRNHNALITLESDGQPGDVYDKVHLVPFGEYIPFGQLAQAIGLRSFAARDGYGFNPGAGVRLIDTPLGRALPLICYEAIFPAHGRGLERPDYLLQITNDAWFGKFSGPFQHLDQARFRAVEQGLPLIRVANTGVSGVIDAYGRVTTSLDLGETGFLDATVPVARAETIYARTGDIPVILILLASLGALIVAQRRNAIAKGA